MTERGQEEVLTALALLVLIVIAAVIYSAFNGGDPGQIASIGSDIIRAVVPILIVIAIIIALYRVVGG